MDNTLRFSLLFDFAKGGLKKSGSGGAGISYVDDTPKKAKKEEPKKDGNTSPAPVQPTPAPAAQPDQQATPQQPAPDNSTPATPK